jgi:hypothetical protein
MKNMNRLFGALFLLATVFSACKKDNNTDSTYFRFKVNGASFEATGLLAYAVDFTDEFTLYDVKDQSGKETCYINILATTTPGTYNLGGGDYSGYYINDADVAFSTNWGASEGTVTIEEIDASHVKGTFQFMAFDADTETIKKTITEGEFNVAFR